MLLSKDHDWRHHEDCRRRPNDFTINRYACFSFFSPVPTLNILCLIICYNKPISWTSQIFQYSSFPSSLEQMLLFLSFNVASLSDAISKKCPWAQSRKFAFNILLKISPISFSSIILNQNNWLNVTDHVKIEGNKHSNWLTKIASSEDTIFQYH